MSELDAILEGETSDAAAGRAAAEDDSQGAEDAQGGDAEKSDFDYLLGMNLWSLTFEKVEEINKLFQAKTEELEVVRKTSVEQMWDRDLEALSKTLEEIDAADAEEAEAVAEIAESRRKKAGSKGAPKPAQRPAPKPRGKR